MLRSGVWSLLGVSTCLYLAAACGSSGHASSTIGGGTAGSASNGNGAGTGPDLGNVGNGGSNNSGGGTSGNGETCAADLVKAERIPLDMYVMLDVSGSMLSPTEGDVDVTKWQAVSSALSEFFSDTASDGLGIGLQVFPIQHEDAPTSCTSNADCGDAFGPCFLKTCWNYPGGLVACDTALDCGDYGPCVTYGTCENNADYVCNRPGTGLCGTDEDGKDLGNCQVRPSSVCLVTADCRAATYATPAAEIATLPDGRAALIATLSKTMPDENGLTPTGPALQGAIQQAKAWATAHPDHQVVAVLATDGEPTLQTAGNRCGPVQDQADLQAVVNLALAGKNGAPSISTFVVGVLGSDDAAAGAATVLQQIAAAGGSKEAFIVDTAGNVQDEFRSALNAIRASGLSCDLAVPTEDEGKSVDYDEVNVEFTNEVGIKQELYRVDGAAACADAPSGQGWYYDTDPKEAAPTRISVCPTVCTEFQKTNMGSVNIALGCETRVVVK